LIIIIFDVRQICLYLLDKMQAVLPVSCSGRPKALLIKDLGVLDIRGLLLSKFILFFR